MAKVLIIAEAGVNHNGNLELAKKMAPGRKRIRSRDREMPDGKVIFPCNEICRNGRVSKRKYRAGNDSERDVEKTIIDVRSV